MHATLCPHDFYKDAMKMEETCQLAPPAAKLLELPNHKNSISISLTGWVMVLLMHICKHRDGCSLLYSQINCDTHHYQLT